MQLASIIITWFCSKQYARNEHAKLYTKILQEEEMSVWHTLSWDIHHPLSFVRCNISPFYTRSSLSPIRSQRVTSSNSRPCPLSGSLCKEYRVHQETQQWSEYSMVQQCCKQLGTSCSTAVRFVSLVASLRQQSSSYNWGVAQLE
jgi:hypothetical protein